MATNLLITFMTDPVALTAKFVGATMTFPGLGSKAGYVISDNPVTDIGRAYIQNSIPTNPTNNYTLNAAAGFDDDDFNPGTNNVSFTVTSTNPYVAKVNLRIAVAVDWLSWTSPNPAVVAPDISSRAYVRLHCLSDDSYFTLVDESYSSRAGGALTPISMFVPAGMPLESSLGGFEFTGEIKNAKVTIFLVDDDYCFEAVVTYVPPDPDGGIDPIMTNPLPVSPPSDPPLGPATTSWEQTPTGMTEAWRQFTKGTEPPDIEKVHKADWNWTGQKQFAIVKKDGVTEVGPNDIDLQGFKWWDENVAFTDDLYNVPLQTPVRSGHIDNVMSAALNAEKGVISTRKNLIRVCTGLWDMIRSHFTYTWTILRDLYDQIIVLNNRIDKIVYFMGPIDMCLFADALFHPPQTFELTSGVSYQIGDILTSTSPSTPINALNWQAASVVDASNSKTYVQLLPNPYDGSLAVSTPVDGDNASAMYTGIGVAGWGATPGAYGNHMFAATGLADAASLYNHDQTLPTGDEVIDGNALLHGWKMLDIDCETDLPLDGKFRLRCLMNDARENSHSASIKIAVLCKGSGDTDWTWRNLFAPATYLTFTSPANDTGGWYPYEISWTRSAFVNPSYGYGVTGNALPTGGIPLRTADAAAGQYAADMKVRKIAIIVTNLALGAVDRDGNTNQWTFGISTVEAWTRGRAQVNL